MGGSNASLLFVGIDLLDVYPIWEIQISRLQETLNLRIPEFENPDF